MNDVDTKLRQTGDSIRDKNDDWSFGGDVANHFENEGFYLEGV